MGCSKRVIRRLSFRILPVARSHNTLSCKQQSMNCHKYTGCGGNLQVYAHFCCCVSATLMHSLQGDEQADTKMQRGRCKHPHHPSAPPPPLRGRVAHQYEEYERSLPDERTRI